jgi:threonine dehydratase
MKVTIEEIRAAAQVLQPTLIRTQLTHSQVTSQRLGTDIYLKFENEQRTGSFKIRGAMNKIASLSASEKARGIICCSAGNHAQGVAFSARQLGVKATVVMPTNAPLVKITATRGYGADVIIHGEFFDESFRHAKELEKEKGYVFVHPFEDEKIIAGQGTVGLEIAEGIADLDTVIVPIGGGGLISGIGIAVKSLHPKARVIGVQSDQAPGMNHLYKHQPYEPKKGFISTIADGIAVKYASQLMCDSFISKVVDEIVTVSDDEIAEAIVYIIETSRSVVEGSGAAGLAAALSGKIKLGRKNCVVLSGGNIDLNIISKVIERGLQKKGRMAKLTVVVPDLPGSLSRMTQVIAERRANVLEVHHDRVSAGLGLKETVIEFVFETVSHEQIQEIRQAMIEAGARLVG